MKKTDKTLLLLVLRFLRATPFVVFVFFLFYMVWIVLLCSRTRYAASIPVDVYLDQLRLFRLLCLTVCDHIIISCISLG